MRKLLIAFVLLFGVSEIETFHPTGVKVKAESPDSRAMIQKEYPEHPQGITAQNIIIPSKLDEEIDTKFFDEVNAGLMKDRMPPLEKVKLVGGQVIWIQTFTEKDPVNTKP